MEKTQNHRPTVLVFLPDIFSVRNFLFTPLWNHLLAADDVDFVIISSASTHGEYIAAQCAANIFWKQMGRDSAGGIYHLLADFPSNRPVRTLQPVPRLLFEQLISQLQYEIHVRLRYRFNHLKGFETHRLKQALPKAERYKQFGELRYLGWPLPDSEGVFNGLYWLLGSARWPIPSWLRSIYVHHRPDLTVIAFPQTVGGFVVNQVAQRSGSPVVAYINSWDQPTTKGPLPPGIQHCMVWNQQMRRELIDFFGMAPETVSVVGGAHLDLYFQNEWLLPREEFLASLGIDPAHKLLVYGTYTRRLGPDEPAVARHIAQMVAANRYTAPTTLIIRPHPKDSEWSERFGALANLPQVQIRLPSNFGVDKRLGGIQQGRDDLQHLTNLMKHADVVVNGPGTLALDAAAFDTPVVNVAFDGDRDLPYERSIAFRYDFDHYAKVIQTGGTWLVKDYGELDTAINTYLNDPSCDSAGRARIRQEMLAPFDGQAGQRIMAQILRILDREVGWASLRDEDEAATR